jgi:hypothetical protein
VCGPGLSDRLLAQLQRKLDGLGQIEWTLWCIDGSHVRVYKAAAGLRENPPPGAPANRALGGSHGGFGSKLHFFSDSWGLPLAIAVSPARHTSRGSSSQS